MLARTTQTIRLFNSKRAFSSAVKISEEVQQALNDKKPVVSLESTIITHGLPFPQNLEMAQKVEQTIRDNGCVPATTAFIEGVPTVGLSAKDLDLLTQVKNVNKVSRRDVGYTIANKLHGGTTISGTMILSKLAGIKVFATGGLGGVHRDGENTMDVSADLEELSRTNVAVVCAGPKAILDIERTMEYLETKGVFVGTYGPKGTNVPGFYTTDSGVKSPYNFQDFTQAARTILETDKMGLGNGYLFCIPPPAEVALSSDFITSVVDEAVALAAKNGVKGKEITPFILSRVAEASKGVSVKCNVEFVFNNARAASELAVEYNKLV